MGNVGLCEWVRDEFVGSELIYFLVEPAENYERIRSSSAITRYFRSCETSRYKNPHNKNMVRSETI